MEFLKKLSARNKDAWNTRPLLIAVLGDSVSHGCFDVFYNEQGRIDTLYDPESGYAAQLQRRLRREKTVPFLMPKKPEAFASGFLLSGSHMFCSTIFPRRNSSTNTRASRGSNCLPACFSSIDSA